MGHELAGVVSATPHDASSFKEGDRVAIFRCHALTVFPAVAKPCIVQKLFILWLAPRWWFCQSSQLREWNLMKLPDNVSMDDAALVEPTAVVIHALRKLALDASDRRVCVISAGFSA